MDLGGYEAFDCRYSPQTALYAGVQNLLPESIWVFRETATI